MRLFFPNSSLGDPCGEVFPVPRTVPASAPLEPALDALLAGPTPAEQEQGYGGWFSEHTEGLLRSVRIESGTAFVDVDDLRPVIPNASTSCGSASLLAQLDRTVMQFPTVERARYSIQGDQEAFYLWLRLAPPG